jgi:Xaa-Pro aminopeptidase
MIEVPDGERREPLKALAFSDEEYATRVGRVRESMARSGIDTLLVTDLANISYLCGYQTLVSDWYACLIVPNEGELALHVCDIEIALARVHSRIDRIETVRWNRMGQAPAQLVSILWSLGAPLGTIGVETRRTGLSPHTYQALQSTFPRSTFQDASDLVARIRAIKSPAEIDYMRTAGAYSVAGLAAAEAAIHPGGTDNDIAAAAASAMIAAGSEYFSIDPIVRVGDWHAVVHSSFRRNAVRDGDTIIMEMSGVHERYHAPIYSTAVVGRPSDRLRRLADTALNCIEVLYQNLKPGRAIHDVAVSTRAALKNLDPDIYLSEYYAYPVGLAFPPSWPENSIWIVEGSDEILAPGMTFHAVRSLRIFGVIAAGFSDTIAITDDGFEILTPHRRRLLEI